MTHEQISLLEKEGFKYIGDGMFERTSSKYKDMITESGRQLYWEEYCPMIEGQSDNHTFFAFDSLFEFLQQLNHRRNV